MTEIDLADTPLNDGIKYLIKSLNENEKKYREKLTEYEKLFQEKYPYLVLAVLQKDSLNSFTGIRDISELTEEHLTKCKIYTSYWNALQYFCSKYDLEKSRITIGISIIVIKNSNYDLRKYSKNILKYNIDQQFEIPVGVSMHNMKKMKEMFGDEIKEFSSYHTLPNFLEIEKTLDELKNNYISEMDCLYALFSKFNPYVYCIYDTNDVGRTIYTCHSLRVAENKLEELSKITKDTKKYHIVMRHCSFLKKSQYLLNINDSSFGDADEKSFMEFIE